MNESTAVSATSAVLADVKPAGTIKTMQLYSHIGRIWNELKELGFTEDGSDQIDVAIINKFDCYNYGGAAGAVSSCVTLGLTESSLVLDVGSGLGGPARCIADHSGCSVRGIELQPDLTELANALTRRCGAKLADRVSFTCGNILDNDNVIGAAGSFDAAMSWLVILHLPLSTRHAAFARIYALLKPGGRVYIEDFFRRDNSSDNSSGSMSQTPNPIAKQFTDAERVLLRDEVYVPDGDLPDREEYISTLESIGFEVDFEDVTDTWIEFTSARCEAWKQSKVRQERVHNEPTWRSLDRFYSAIVTLFIGGTLGGVRLVLTKPATKSY